MADLHATLGPQLPFLRRYARALTGSQESGDRFVRQCLEALLADGAQLNGTDNLRRELYRYFHALFLPFEALEQGGDSGDELGRKLAALTPRERQLLLLTAMENFRLADAAYVVGTDEAEAGRLLAQARDALFRQAPTKVLIIEDEPVIALGLSDIVRQGGHAVAGVAATRSEAVALAKSAEPGLVLADVQLRDGSSGVDAVRQILRESEVPVIFITAFPERVLTGQGIEPTFVLTKPFNAATVLTTISQVLSIQR